MQYQRSLIEQLAARVGLSPAPRRNARPTRNTSRRSGRNVAARRAEVAAPRRRPPRRPHVRPLAGRGQVTRPGRQGSPGPQDAAIVCTVFGIGVTEMIVIGLVILMLFSPRELPGMMKTLARAYGSIRRTAEEFRAQVMDAEELREPIEEIRAAYHGTKTELLSAQELARRELGRARAEAMKAQQKLSELAREESRREVSILKGRISASESPDAPPVAGPGTPISSAPPLASPSAPNSSAPALASSAPNSSAPAVTSSASTLATANTIPTPPVAPTPGPCAPGSSPRPLRRPFASPTLAQPSPTKDRSDAA